MDHYEKLKRNFTKSLEWKARIGKNDISSSSRYQLDKDPSPIEDIKVYKNRPYKVGVYFKFPDHVPTKKDFECLSPFKAVVCDDRPFKVLLIRFLIEDHAIFNIIYKKSLFNPRWAEIFFLCFTYSLLFAVNALFYTDSYIDASFDRTGNVKIIFNFKEGFFVSFILDFPRTFLALFMTIFITAVVNLLQYVPIKYEKKLNEALKTKDKTVIKHA